MSRRAAYRIRRAHPDEAGTIRDLVRRAYAMYVPRIGKKPGPMLDDYAARIAGRSVYVLETDGAVAGLLVLLPGTDHLLLDNVAVDPALQGRGFGRTLIEFAGAEARRRGYPEIRLYTHEKMAENLLMYTRLGYVETHRVGEHGYDRVYMTKFL